MRTKAMMPEVIRTTAKPSGGRRKENTTEIQALYTGQNHWRIVLISFLLRPSSFLENKKVITLKRKNHEKGYLEIHHSDRSSHTDCHRYQPWGYQLYVKREPTPSPSQEEGDKKEDEQHCSSSNLLFIQAIPQTPCEIHCSL